VSPPHPCLVEPSAKRVGSLVEVTPGFPMPSVVNMEVGLSVSLKPDIAYAAELTVEDYKELASKEAA
jgi:hypothetical protein